MAPGSLGLVFLFCFVLFILREREGEHLSKEGQRKRERIPGRLCTVSTEPRARTYELQDHDLSRNQESDTQPTEPPRRSWIIFLMSVYLFLRECVSLGVGEGQRERQSVSWGGAERKGDTESEAGSRLRAVSTEPNTGLEPTNCEITT